MRSLRAREKEVEQLKEAIRKGRSERKELT